MLAWRFSPSSAFCLLLSAFCLLPSAFHAQTAGQTSDSLRQSSPAGLIEIGQYAEAEASAKKSLEKNKDDADARLLLGEVYAATGRYKEAISEFEAAGKGAAAKGQTSFARLRSDLRRGEVLLLTGQEDAARTLFQSLVGYYNSANPQTAPELTLVARSLWHLEKYKDANEVFMAAIAADPNYIEAHLGSGELFTEKYNYAEAAEFFRDALKINPNSARAHLGVALNKQLEGGAEMLAALTRALEINPNLVGARCLLAKSELEAERYDAAALEIEKALKVNPNSLEAISLRASLLYLRDQDYEREVKAALAINPRYGQIFDTLSHFATITRRYAEAAQFSRRGTEIAPRLWRAHLSLGVANLRLGREQEGRAAIETAFKGDPFNVWAKNTLDLLDTMGDYQVTKRGPFVVKAVAKENEAVAPYAAELLEEATAKLTAKYKFTPQAPIIVELYPNHEDFAVRTLGLPGLGALGVCFGQVIALDSPSARPVGQFNWGSTLWHEYTHVMTLQMTNYRIPRWFSEGLSVYEERRARPGWGDDWNPTVLKALADGRWFKIADLDAGFQRPRTPADVPLAYFQASQICEFIAERYGFDAVLSMLALYRDKAKTGEVIKRVLKLSEEEFDRAFGEYVRAKASPMLRALEAGANVRRASELTKESTLEALRANPESFALLLRAGTIFQTEGDADKAVLHLKRAAELFPFYTEKGNAYELLAEIHEKRGDKKAAADALEALVKYDENNLGALKRLAELRRADNDPARALDALRMSFYISPFDHAAHTEAGEMHLARGEAPPALREFQVALALGPPNVAEANYNVARAHLAANQPAEAKRAVLRALEAAPGYEKAQELLLKVSGK